MESRYNEARPWLVENVEMALEHGHHHWLYYALEALAAVSAESGEAERAARLLGAAQSLYEEGGRWREELEEERLQQTIAKTGAILGQARYEHAFTEGRALLPAAAAEFVLAS